MKHIIVNGKIYPMWEQFVLKKDEWIGGKLIDHEAQMITKIIDIILKPNGKESAWFGVVGEDFDCGFDVQYGGIGGDGHFHGMWGLDFEIKEP